MDKIILSIIIVSHKNLEVLRNCLDSIYLYNDIGECLEIIVVDNSPEDNIYHYIKNNYSDIIILRMDNKGFGAANNVGAKIAKGKYLLFLNPDTILIEPIFKFAINQFEKDDKLSMFGVKLLNKNKKRNLSFGFIDKMSVKSMILIRILNKLNIYIDGKMFISGADMFVRKRDFINIGMFDENIFMYKEEADLSKRLKANGGKTRYFKSKSIIHLEGKTINDSEAATLRKIESLKYFCEKYNLNFQRRFRQNLRYQYFKYFFYWLSGNNEAKKTKKSILLLKDLKVKLLSEKKLI